MTIRESDSSINEQQNQAVCFLQQKFRKDRAYHAISDYLEFIPIMNEDLVVPGHGQIFIHDGYMYMKRGF